MTFAVRRASLFLVASCLAVVAAGCPGPKPAAAPSNTPAKVEEGPLVWKMSKSGLGFRLSNADDEADHPRAREVTPATPLGAADARKILSRLPELKREHDDEKDFALRAKSLPAPRPGKTVNESFPPAGGPPPATPTSSGPLKIERHAPEGPVALAPHLSITFSQPMVSVTSVDELKEHPPVRLSPEPPGKWRWLGTRTVMFQPEKRFPMATEYSVEIPAGTRSTTGGALATAERWTFTTPPPTLKQSHPHSSSEPLDPLVYLEFDQAIEPNAMLASIELKSSGGSTPIRLAAPDEIEANDVVRRLAQSAEKGRYLAFRPVNKLSTGTPFIVRVKKGAPSAEGPQRTASEQALSFSTFGPMTITHSECLSYRYDGKPHCAPLAPFSINFSNPVDLKSFDKGMISVSPEIPNMRVDVQNHTLVIRGKTKGRTKYTVNVAGTIGDTHGQTMGTPASVSFAVDSADPAMFGAEREMIVLDPLQKKKEYDVFTINEPGLRARLYAVRPEDYAKYLSFNEEWERPRRLRPPGRLVYDKVLTPKKAPDELVSTAIDLTGALSEGTGHALIVVEPTRPMPKGYERPELHLWIQATEIGLDALFEDDQITGWATKLVDGTPMEGVEVQLLGSTTKVGRTDAQGLARVPLTSSSGSLVVGRKGKDSVIIPERYGTSSYSLTTHIDAARWLVYDDRGMYKPGEEVRVKGWIRRIGMQRDGDLDAVPNITGKTVSFEVRDPRWAEIGKGTTTVDEYGAFDLAYKIPTNANTGRATISLHLEGISLDGVEANHSFQIEEFRRPEFEVTARATDGPHFVGRHAVATLTAAYYSGGGLPDAPVHWVVESTPTSYAPIGRGDYHFGPEPDFFWSWRSRQDSKSGPKQETWTAKTNPQGVHRLRIDFDAIEPSYPLSLSLTGTVEDVNRQQWAGRTAMIVHPSDIYAGLRPTKGFLRQGENIETDVILVDVDGKPTAGHAIVKAARVDWEQKGTEYVETLHDEQTCEVANPKDVAEPTLKQHCSFKTQRGGTWRLWSVVTDEHGRKNQSTTSVWVMGGDSPKDRSIERAKVNLLLDKKEYAPGDMSEVLVVAPFAPAEGLLTVQRQGIVHLERFSMKTTSQVLKVKLNDAFVPNVLVRVDLVGQDSRTNDVGAVDDRLPKRPAFASGSVSASILPSKRTLAVATSPKRPTLEPGGSTQIDVTVKDPDGRPVPNAEVALVVSDEAVLALSGYKTPDPIATFYSARQARVRELGMRDRVRLGEPELTALRGMNQLSRADVSGGFAAQRPMPGKIRLESASIAPAEAPAPPPTTEPKPAMKKVLTLSKDDMKEEVSIVGDSSKPMQVRSDFSALALFIPKAKTDGGGRVTVPVKLPDNLTRYRVMAVAATKSNSFGSSESTITAKLPLMARPSAPRFLNFGDKFELPVVVQNQTDQPIDVAVVARATNATVDEPSAKRVKIAANDRAEVRFNAATVKPGTARFQFGIASGSFSDASEIALPVWTPATTEAFATYGEIDEGAMAQPVKMPPGVFPQFGGLEITTSSTQLQALTDAIVYLYKYPFECNEQLASRVITISALRDVLTAFKSKDLPPPSEIEASMKQDFEKLKRRQHYSGGWGFWQEQPWPYLTIHVAHALQRAKEKGYKPDSTMLDRAQGYLRSIESHIPAWYGEEARRALIAYSIYVRHRMGDADAAKAKRLISDAGGVDRLGIEAIGWIWPTISADKSSTSDNEAIRRHIGNRVTETAGNAHFVSGYKDADWVLLNSDRRADGVLLEAMIGDQKESTLIPKLVKGLLAHRKAGRWYNTQENAFVLLGLDRYFNTYEKVTPDFVARVWLGDKFAGDHAFKGRTTEYSHIGIPMQFLANEKAKEQNLIIGKDGPGRLYYRVGMQYAPTNLKLPPADHGFVVSRLYEAVDSNDDVKRDPDGTWRVKAGAKVRVRVSMVAQSRRYHVALVDPIPAGLEPMNPALAVTGEIPKDPKAAETSARGNPYWYWSRTWYEHQNMRDERVEAFTSLLWDGVWDYTYVARATTPGTFVVPPTKAEEMYSPETFGRSAGDRMIVE